MMPILLWMGLLSNISADAKKVAAYLPSAMQQFVDQPTDSLKLKITVGEKILYADIYDSETARDFIKLLPLELDMQDLNRREKYRPLTVRLPNNGTIKNTYEVGDISYWLGGGLTVFYQQDHATVKAGLIKIGKLKEGMEVFETSESLKVKFEVIKNEVADVTETQNTPSICTE